MHLSAGPALYYRGLIGVRALARPPRPARAVPGAMGGGGGTPSKLPRLVQLKGWLIQNPFSILIPPLICYLNSQYHFSPIIHRNVAINTHQPSSRWQKFEEDRSTSEVQCMHSAGFLQWRNRGRIPVLSQYLLAWNRCKSLYSSSTSYLSLPQNHLRFVYCLISFLFIFFFNNISCRLQWYRAFPKCLLFTNEKEKMPTHPKVQWYSPHKNKKTFFFGGGLVQFFRKGRLN